MEQIWPETQGYADCGLGRSGHRIRGAEENLSHVHCPARPPEFKYPILPESLIYVPLRMGASQVRTGFDALSHG